MTPKQALELAKGKEELDDLWTTSLRRVFEFKRGAFFEHSVSVSTLNHLSEYDLSRFSGD